MLALTTFALFLAAGVTAVAAESPFPFVISYDARKTRPTSPLGSNGRLARTALSAAGMAVWQPTPDESVSGPPTYASRRAFPTASRPNGWRCGWLPLGLTASACTTWTRG